MKCLTGKSGAASAPDSSHLLQIYHGDVVVSFSPDSSRGSHVVPVGEERAHSDVPEDNSSEGRSLCARRQPKDGATSLARAWVTEGGAALESDSQRFSKC